MARAIDHNTGSGVLTAASSTAKWGLGGAIAAAAIGGGLVIGTLMLGGALLGLGATAAFTGGAAIFAWTAVITASLATGISWGPIGAILGALFGLAKGGSRVSAEKAAYRDQAEALTQNRQQTLAQKITDAKIVTQQETYPVAFNDGRASVMHELQTMAIQQDTAQAAPAAGTVAMASAEAKCECGPHTKAVIEQRQAAAVAGVTPQVG